MKGAKVVFCLIMLLGACLLASCGTGGTPAAGTRTITDMGGRKVQVPLSIQKVFCSNPIGTADTYMLDPELLAGWNYKPAGEDTRYIKSKYLALPALGVWMGAGATPNIEEIRKANPDVILCFWTADSTGVQMADEIQKQAGVPVVLVDYDIRSSDKTFDFLGSLLNRTTRGQELSAYCRETLDKISAMAAAVPASGKKTVYIAEGKGGLQTDSVGSMHVQDTFDLLGCTNVVYLPGSAGKGMGMPSVSLEQVIKWQPDVVLVSEYSMSNSRKSTLYQEIRKDSAWKNVKAVKDGHVYRIPQSPFAWIGRPPSAARLLGCLWLGKLLYGDKANVDVKAETVKFYRLLYGVNLTDQEVASILEYPGIG